MDRQDLNKLTALVCGVIQGKRDGLHMCKKGVTHASNFPVISSLSGTTVFPNIRPS